MRRRGTVVVWALTAPFIFGTACRPPADPKLDPTSHAVEVGDLFTSTLEDPNFVQYRLELHGGLRLYAFSEAGTEHSDLGAVNTGVPCDLGCEADILCYRAGDASVAWRGAHEPLEAPVECSAPDEKYAFKVNSSFAQVEGHCGAEAVVVEMTATGGFSDLEATVELALWNQQTEVRETLTFEVGQCLGSLASTCFVDEDRAYVLFDRKAFGSETSFEIEVSEPGADPVTSTAQITCPGGSSGNNGVVSNIKPLLVNPCEHLMDQDVAAAFGEAELPRVDDGYFNEQAELAGCVWGGVTSFADPWRYRGLEASVTVFQTGLATGAFDDAYWNEWRAGSESVADVEWSPNGKIKTVQGTSGATTTYLVAKLIEDRLGRDIHIEIEVAEAVRSRSEPPATEPLGPDDATLVAGTLEFGKLISDAIRAAQPDGVMLPPEGE